LKRILITGGAGFIGSTLADKLLERGDEVVCLDNFSSQYDPRIKRRNINAALSHPRYKLYEDDIRQSRRITDLFTLEKPDIVVHIAGCTGMAASDLQAAEFHETNVGGTLNVLEACRASGVGRLVFASTASVYGHTTLPATEESALPRPLNTYIATKRLGEHLIRAFAEIHGLQTMVLRLATVYGPRQRAEMAVTKFARLINEGKPVPVYGNGSAARNYLHIEDCIDGIVLAADQTSGFEIVNLGGRNPTSLLELIDLLVVCLGKKVAIEYTEAPKEIPDANCLEIAKARSLLGYEPLVSIKDGLRRFISWYLEIGMPKT